MEEVETPPVVRTPSRQVLRFFSIDSRNSTRDSQYYENVKTPQWKHDFKSAEFIIKFFELLVSVICAGAYSKGILILKTSITSQTFPNVVFSTFIIITSVITISYVLGYVMPDVLSRIFNTLGSILYLVTTVITGYEWVVLGQVIAEEEGKYLELHMLLVVIVCSGLNTFLYAIDVGLNIRRVMKEIDSV